MWKQKNEEERPKANPVASPKEVRSVDTPRHDTRNSNSNDVAHIGKSVLIKGELSGSEDLYLDGEVEGTIELHQNSLTVGPNARIRAHIHAREVVIHGKVDGNITGSERVELRRSAVLVGDVTTQRISVEDGAFFKGAIDVQREAKQEAKPAPSYAAAAVPTGVGIGAAALAEKK
jgi:cytoskeletal protein CcmA (bactofilin family)